MVVILEGIRSYRHHSVWTSKDGKMTVFTGLSTPDSRNICIVEVSFDHAYFKVIGGPEFLKSINALKYDASEPDLCEENLTALIWETIKNNLTLDLFLDEIGTAHLRGRDVGRIDKMNEIKQALGVNK